MGKEALTWAETLYNQYERLFVGCYNGAGETDDDLLPSDRDLNRRRLIIAEEEETPYRDPFFHPPEAEQQRDAYIAPAAPVAADPVASAPACAGPSVSTPQQAVAAEQAAAERAAAERAAAERAAAERGGSPRPLGSPGSDGHGTPKGRATAQTRFGGGPSPPPPPPETAAERRAASPAVSPEVGCSADEEHSPQVKAALRERLRLLPAAIATALAAARRGDLESTREAWLMQSLSALPLLFAGHAAVPAAASSGEAMAKGSSKLPTETDALAILSSPPRFPPPRPHDGSPPPRPRGSPAARTPQVRLPAGFEPPAGRAEGAAVAAVRAALTELATQELAAAATREASLLAELEAASSALAEAKQGSRTTEVTHRAEEAAYRARLEESMESHEKHAARLDEAERKYVGEVLGEVLGEVRPGIRRGALRTAGASPRRYADAERRLRTRVRSDQVSAAATIEAMGNELRAVEAALSLMVEERNAARRLLTFAKGKEAKAAADVGSGAAAEKPRALPEERVSCRADLPRVSSASLIERERELAHMPRGLSPAAANQLASVLRARGLTPSVSADVLPTARHRSNSNGSAASLASWASQPGSRGSLAGAEKGSGPSAGQPSARPARETAAEASLRLRLAQYEAALSSERQRAQEALNVVHSTEARARRSEEDAAELRALMAGGSAYPRHEPRGPDLSKTLDAALSQLDQAHRRLCEKERLQTEKEKLHARSPINEHPGLMQDLANLQHKLFDGQGPPPLVSSPLHGQGAPAPAPHEFARPQTRSLACSTSKLAFDLASIGAAVHGAGGAEGGSAAGQAAGGGGAGGAEGSGGLGAIPDHMRSPQGMGALAGISAAAVASARRGDAPAAGESFI